MDERPIEYHDCSECESEDGKPGLVLYLGDDGECQTCGLGY